MNREINNKKFLILTLLILSGDLIFILPYFLPRVFRPTFLAVFYLNNLVLGSLFSVYGTVAIFLFIIIYTYFFFRIGSS